MTVVTYNTQQLIVGIHNDPFLRLHSSSDSINLVQGVDLVRTHQVLADLVLLCSHSLLLCFRCFEFFCIYLDSYSPSMAYLGHCGLFYCYLIIILCAWSHIYYLYAYFYPLAWCLISYFYIYDYSRLGMSLGLFIIYLGT